jgi:flagellar motor switch protein FliN/FliY
MGDERDTVSSEEIERLLQQSMGQSPSPGAVPAAAPAPPTAQPNAEAPSTGKVTQSEIEALLVGVVPEGKTPAGAAVLATDDADKKLGQDDIEKLLNQAGKGGAAAPPPPKPASARKEATSGPLFPGEGDMPQKDLDFLLSQAEQALASIDDQDGPNGATTPPGVVSFRLEEFSSASPSTEVATLDLIRDVELDVKIELGRTNMYLEDVLKLRRGSVVPLDKLAGDPVDIFVNGRLVARGEVLVLNDNFCVRIAELVAGVNVGG